MEAIIHKAAVGVQPSAGTSFNLLPTAEQVAFSWDQTIDKKEDESGAAPTIHSIAGEKAY